MNRYFSIALLSLFLPFSAFAHGAEVLLTNSDKPVATGDKMGDAKKLSELRLDSGNGVLVATIKTSGPQFVEIAGDSAVVTGKLFGLAFDSDNNNGSGGTPEFVSSVKGIERQAVVEVCADEKGNPDEPHCVYGVWGNDLVGAHTNVKVRDVVNKSSDEVTFEGGKISAKEQAVRVEIPYARLGVSAGDTIVVYWLGSQASGAFGPLGEPVTLALN